jgi:hypothetical protein
VSAWHLSTCDNFRTADRIFVSLYWALLTSTEIYRHFPVFCHF